MVISTQAWAISGQEFCESYASLNAPKTLKKHPFKDTLTVLYAPRKIIQVEELESDQLRDSDIVEATSSSSKKVIFIHLPNPTADKIALKKLKKLQKQISKLRLFKLLKKNQDINQCLTFINTYPDDYKSIENYLLAFDAQKNLLESARNQKMIGQVKSMLKPLQRNGWRIVFADSLHSMYHYLAKQSNVEQMMMINHSDELGRLYDAKKNIFPKGAFDNLAASVKKLMIFSCHPKTVIDFYRLQRASASFDYYYPTVTENFIDIFEDRIPVIALNGFKPAAKAKIKNYKNDRDCRVDIQTESSLSNLVISLNDHFLGVLEPVSENQITFNCSLLSKKKNVIKLFYLGAPERVPFILNQILFTNEFGETEALELKTILSSDQQSLILTTGTIGGNL